MSTPETQSDSDFFLPLSFARQQIDAVVDAAEVDAAEGTDVAKTVLPNGRRADWPCGSMVEFVALADESGALCLRLAWAIRSGPIHEEQWDVSPWLRPRETPARSADDHGPERSLSAGALRGHPFGEPVATLSERGRAVLQAAADEDEADHVEANLSAKAREVLGDLDGVRKRAAKAAKTGYAMCVVCGKGIMLGQLYEHQRGKTSPRRRVHVACLPGHRDAKPANVAVGSSEEAEPPTVDDLLGDLGEETDGDW